MKKWHNKLKAAATAGLVAVGLVAAGAAQPAAAEGDCRDAVFQTDGYQAGMTLPNFEKMNATIVPPDWQIIQVAYQDGVIPQSAGAYDKKTLDQAVTDGVATELTKVREFHQRCPGAHITIMGYSEGALIGGGTIEELAKTGEIPTDQINGVLYGDPRRPFAPSGLGGYAGGIETNLPTIFPGEMTFKGPHDFGAIPVSEVCNENDGICNSPNVLMNAYAFVNGIQGYLQGDHGYDFNPWRDATPGDHFNPQPQRFGYGAPLLPFPVPTLWELQQGPLGGAVDAAVNVIRPVLQGVGSFLYPVLGPVWQNMPYGRQVLSLLG